MSTDLDLLAKKELCHPICVEIAQQIEDELDEIKEEDGEEHALATWIMVQVVKYYNDLLSQEQIDRLDSLADLVESKTRWVDRYRGDTIKEFGITTLSTLPHFPI